jgi:hypothetical protein
MSVNLTPVNIGTEPNNGSGDPIRTAFNAVNINFTEIKSKIEGLSNGVINNAGYIDTQVLVANTSTINALTVSNTAIFNSNVTTNSLYVNTSVTATTIESTGNIDVGGNLNIANDVTVAGNLTVLGSASVINSTDLSVHDSLITLHTPSSGTLTANDGKDIGIVFNYYDNGSKNAALVRANDTGALEFYSDGTHTAGVFSGTYGEIKANSFFAADTSANSIRTNGGITAAGTISSLSLASTNLSVTNATISDTLSLSVPLSGRNISGSLWLTGTDTVYVNGIPVTTSTSHFTGGMVPNLAWFVNGVTANSQVVSTSTTSGAMTVDGGLGVTGNIYAGAIRNTPISGSSGDFTSLTVASTFAASSVSFLGGFITNVHGDATQWAVTDFTSGNVRITGGTIAGITSLGASGVALTSGTITGLTNLSTAAATITSGSLTGLSQVTTTNLTSTNGIVVNGLGARIAADFTNATASNRLLFQTTTTNGATNISAAPRGTVVATAITSAFVVEDTSSIATGNGSTGSLEMYQATEVRISAGIRGTGTYLPLSIYTNGTKNAQFATNHDVTIFNTGGTGVISLGANGVVTATSFTGRLIGLADTATLANGVAWANVTGAPTIPTVPTAVSAFTNDSGYITSATLGTYGVSQIVAGTNIAISPVGGTGVVTVSTTATAAAANLTGTTLSSNVTASSLTSVGTLTSLTTSGDVTVGGNLVVNGTTTTINATTLEVADLNITLAKNAASSAAANGAGLTVAGAGATFTYTSADDRWNVNKTINGTITNALAVPWTGISNPPTIPAAQVQTDWNAASGMGVILNKPIIPAAQVQSDWNAASGMGVILNKPTSLPGAKYTESGTAPIGPTAGDRWYNTASDILYQYIGTSWVDVFTAGITATSAATANAIAQRDGTGGAAFSTVTASAVSVSGAITTTGAGTVNIGTNANKFGTIYGTATTAQYADLAEIYMADKNYLPGTVVVFGGRDEITANDHEYDTRIAGVVSTNPAYLMNDVAAGLQETGAYAIPVALTGRVPCRVLGPIKKGDLLVASKFAGVAKAINNAQWVPGCVIGKALSDLPSVEITIIEVVIGRF